MSRAAVSRAAVSRVAKQGPAANCAYGHPQQPAELAALQAAVTVNPGTPPPPRPPAHPPRMTLLALEVGGTRLNTSPVGFMQMRVRPAGRGGENMARRNAGQRRPVSTGNGMCALLCVYLYVCAHASHAAPRLLEPKTSTALGCTARCKRLAQTLCLGSRPPVGSPHPFKT